MFDPALEEFMGDTITIEPFTSQTVTQVKTYGASVSYKALVIAEWSKVIGKDGREFNSTVQVIIPERVHIDPRDRLTLPSGWVPNQPEIISVSPIGGINSIGMDSTEIRC